MFFFSKRRRKILNEDDLVEAVESFTDIDLIDFVGMSMKEQVRSATCLLWEMLVFKFREDVVTVDSIY